MYSLEIPTRTEATLLLPPQEEPVGCSRFTRWMGKSIEKIRRFSSLTSQISLLALDTLYFAAKVSTAIPNKLTQTTLLALSFVGVVALPYSAHFLIKSLRDGQYALRCSNKLSLILSSSRAIETTSNLVMTALGFVAALSGVTGNESLQINLYQSMIAWGITTVALGTLNTLVGLGVERHMLRTLSSPEAQAAASPLLQALVTTPEASAIFQHACKLRLCMDKDTLDKLMTTLIREPDAANHVGIFTVVVSNLNTQQNINLAPKLFLTLVGDGLMAVEKYYTPASFEAACINLIVAGAYTAQLITEVSCEVRQRVRLERAATQAVPA